MQTNKVLSLIALAVVVALGGWYAARHYKAPAAAPTTAASSTPVDLSSISTTTTIGNYTITPIYGSAGGSASAAPDYAKPIPYSPSVTADVKTALEAQFVDIKKTLALNHDDYNAWMRLGTLHKIAGDYQGTITVWAYVAQRWNDYVAYANLGDLYMHNIKDYAKAEASYKKAIAARPDFIEGYGALATLYSSFGYKGSMTAEQVLTQGLKANPNNSILLQLQSQLKAGTNQ